MRTRARLASFVILATAALIASTPARAQQTLQLLVDSDNNPGSGCTIALPGGGQFTGADLVVNTVADKSTGKVTSVTQQTCAVPPSTLSAPASVGAPPPPSTAPWNLGIGNGTAGTDVVESFVPLQSRGQLVRLAAVSAGDSLVTTTPGGANAIVVRLPAAAPDVPTVGEWGLLLLSLLLGVSALYFLRRNHRAAFLLCLLLAAGAATAYAVSIVLDGQTADWAPGDKKADDAIGEQGSPDLAALFIRYESGDLFFRIDAALDQPPTAVADAATVSEDSGASAIDVLANDTDPDGGSKVVQSVTQPANGSVAITGGGTGVSYTPNANYCNNPPGTTLDTFSYTLNGGSSANVSVTVSCVDDAPVAVNDSATVSEDAAATAVDVLANDTDVDGGPRSIASVTQPANGTVVITGGGTGLSYQPNANYCNSVSGPADTFTYTLSPAGASPTATVSITVTCVDDAPVAVADSATVVEDSGASAVDVLANDTDVDGGAKSVTSVTQPANGTVAITGGGTGVSYTPDANYCNNPPGTTLDTFTYTLTPGSSTATVTMTVTCVDDPPAIDLDANDSGGTGGANFATSFTEGNAPVAIEDTADATVTDVDSASLASLTVKITNLLDSGAETLAANTGGTSITASYVAGTGVLTLTGPDTLANFVQVLRTITYVDTDDDPDTSAPRSITFVVNDGSSNSNTATATVTLAAVDDAPVAVNDSATVVEDSSSNAIDVLANDTDVDGGPKSIASVTQPANGSVAITGGGTGVSYTPNANYCNSVSGPADTFTYTLTPAGATPTATVSVTVTCVDDAPIAVNDSATVGEDSGATAINVLANDTDLDGGPKLVQSVTQPANGAVVITGGGTGLTYQPNADYCNTPPGTTLDTFTYTLTPGGSSATVSVAVTCVDDAPVIDLDADDSGGTSGADFAVTYTEGNPAKLLEDPTDATLTDVDSATLTSLTVTITNVLDPGFETLNANVTGTSITSNYVPATGVLTLTGPDTVAHFQTVLRTVQYLDTDNDPDATPRVIHFVASDGTASSNTATSTVTVVPVDSSPVAVNDSATVVEDSGANAIDVLANDTDSDGGPKSIASVTQPTNGTVAITGGGTGLTYTPNANYCNTPPGTTLDTFTYTLAPGGSSATVTVSVTCVDDNPVAVADSATVVEDSGATAVPVLANDTDVDGGPKSISAVTQPANGVVVITGGGTGLTYAPNANYCNTPPGTTLDTFTYTLAPGGSSTTVTMTVTCVDDAPVAVNDSKSITEDDPATAIDVLANDTDVDGGPKSVASVTQPAGGVVVITGGGTGLTYQPNANFCTPGSPDTFTYTLAPGGSTATVSVSVTCVDDPPIAVNDAATITEDDPATAIPVLTNDTDVDGGPKSIASVTQPTNGTVVITGGGTGLTYQPNANYCNNPSGSPDTFTYTLTPASATPTATVSVTVICVNDPPVLATNPITYTTPGNTQLHVAGATIPGVASWSDAQNAITKSSPSDVDGPGPLEVVAASGSSTNGGSFSIATDGSFTYVPPAGFTGTDSFTYVVTDNGAPAATATGTINITVGTRVWYIRDVVDTDNPAGGDGRSTNAFDSIAAFNAATTNAGDIIYVFEGNTATTPLTGSITLKDSQKLWGQGINLDVPGFGTSLVTATSRPHIRSTAASTPAVSVPATAGNRNFVEIKGVDLETTGGSGGTASNAIDVTATGANTVGVTINGNNIRGATGKGINLSVGGTGAFDASLDNNAVVSTGNGVDASHIAGGTGTLTLSFSNNAVSSGATGVRIDAMAAGTTFITNFASNSVSRNNGGTGMDVNIATFDATPGGGFTQVSGGTTVIGTSGDGVGGSGLVMTTVKGDLFFNDLDVFADGGQGILIIGTGAYNESGGNGTRVRVSNGVGISEAIGGPALSLNNMTADFRLNSLKSTNSATTGVALGTVVPGLNAVDGQLASQVSAPSGSSISNATGIDFSVSSNNSTVTYGGTITDTTGGLVAVTSSSGGSVSFSGAISDTGSGTGQGITLTNNTGATIGFTGPLTLSTGANAAFTATGGGTVTSTDTTSTITTTTGTAINVANTTIGAGGLKFKKVSAGTSASGPVNGILLNTTGSGVLTVLGDGSTNSCKTGVTTCSGGTIQKTTGDGVSITNGRVDLSLMWIKNCANSGIKGTTVPALKLTDLLLQNNTNSTGEQAGILINDLSDSNAQVTRVEVSGSTEDNVRIHNSNVTGTITLSNCTIKDNSTTSGNIGVFFQTNTTGNLTGTVQNSTLSGNRTIALRGDSGDGSTLSATFSGNTITAGSPNQGNQGIEVSRASTSTLTFNVTGNTITGMISTLINVFSGSGPGTGTGDVKSNTCTGTGIGGNQFGIRVFNSGTSVVGQGTLNVNVANNTVSNIDNAYPIIGESSNSSGSGGLLKIAVTGNNASVVSGGTALDAIRIQARNTSTVCGKVSGNTTNTGGPGFYGIQLRQANTSTFNLEGLSSGPQVEPTVHNYLVSQNPAAATVSSDGTVTGTITGVPTGNCGITP